MKRTEREKRDGRRQRREKEKGRSLVHLPRHPLVLSRLGRLLIWPSKEDRGLARRCALRLGAGARDGKAVQPTCRTPTGS